MASGFEKVTSLSKSSTRKTKLSARAFISLYGNAVKQHVDPATFAHGIGYSQGQLKSRVNAVNKSFEEKYDEADTPTDKRVYLPTPIFAGVGKKGRKKADIGSLIALVGSIDAFNPSNIEESEEVDYVAE